LRPPKKADLENAGKVWATESKKGRVKDNTADAYKHLSPESVEILKAGARPKDTVVNVMPMNWKAVLTFLRFSDLWRYSSGGSILGLDWAQIESKSRMLRLRIKPKVYMGMEIIEGAAKEEFNK